LSEDQQDLAHQHHSIVLYTLDLVYVSKFDKCEELDESYDKIIFWRLKHQTRDHRVAVMGIPHFINMKYQ
jgi:hypothetical protein